MDIFNKTIIWIIIAVLFLALTVYFFFQLKLKKRNELTLGQSINSKSDELEKLQQKLQRTKAELTKTTNENIKVIELSKNEASLQKSEKSLTKKVEKLEVQIQEITDSKKDLEIELLSMKKQISIYQPVLDLANVGFFEEPDYLYETSERFKAEIKSIRDKQKGLIKNNEAIKFPDKIAMTDDSTYVKKVLTGQAKLMLKAFNVECDILMGLVKPSNYARTLERINKTANDLEKSSVALKCSFHTEYIALKYKECELQYQFKLKYEEEREEQALIREQIREEQKVIKEYERAIAAAEKEERIYRAALEKAKNDLNEASESQKAELQQKIDILELQLKEAEEKEQRVKSLAEQTRKGHVYIISNIGSFGENVYKIGLTRRLDPMDRVKELGDASVPFPFDVHAIIYNEDAPALETQLHKEFRHMRVNKVNKRKEFFILSLEEIRSKVKEVTGNDENFKMTAAAENYYESLKLSSSK
jgi:hypothetical protein